MAAKKQFFITITDDGDIRVDASQMPGAEQEIRELLDALATEVGGDPAMLKIEKHVHKHTHGKVQTHTHVQG